MGCQRVEDTGPISYQALIDKNHALEDEIKNLRVRLAEAEELQRAISEGDLDALVIPRPEGELIFTLNSADYAYRVLVETMNEGTVTLAFDGTILYCNRRFAKLLRMKTQDIVSKSIYRFIAPEDLAIFREILERKKNSGEVKLYATGGKSIPVYLSISSMQAEDSQNAWCIVVTDLTNITEHMRNEEALKKAYEEIQAKSEEIQVQNEELQAQSEELQVANEALAESEERLRLLGDNLPDSAVYQYTHELDGSVRFLYISAGIERLNGISSKDVLRDPNTLHSQIPLEYFKRLVEAEALSAREMSDFDMETPMHLPDGQVRWMHLHSRPRRLPNGRTLWDGVQIDITERKRNEDALRESEARIKITEAIEAERHLLFGVLETLPAMVCLLTPDHHYTFTNRTFREKFGEPGARHCYECCFGLDKPCDFCEAYKVLETGQSHYWEVTTPDGSIIDVYNYPFTDVDGSPMILEMDFDITERKKAEENIRRLANIVESSNDAIVTKSLDGIITSWNKGAEQLYGYSAEEVLGKPVSILEPPMLSDETKKLTEMIKQGEENIQYETLRIRKDGKVIHVSIALSPVFDINGKLNAISVIARDITKRKEAEEALAKIEIARKKEIHHRIKNNLQVISSLLDLQAEQFKDKEFIKDSEVLEAFRESQDRVISMALIHEELYKGGEFETLNFSPYIQKLAENIYQTYSVRNNNISLKLDLAENAFFDMDISVPLGMIITELVTNSFKHAFKGRESGEIHIKLHREENGECVNCIESESFVLTVSDNGIGIPEDLEIEELDSLGMQLVITLVDQLDGTFEIKRDNGTEFTVRFTVTENNNSTKERLPTSIG